MCYLKTVPVLVAFLTIAAGNLCQAQTALKADFDAPAFVEVRHQYTRETTANGRSIKTELSTRFVFKLEKSDSDSEMTTIRGTVLKADGKLVSKGETQNDVVKAFAGQKFSLAVQKRNQKVTVTPTLALLKAMSGDQNEDLTDDQKRTLSQAAEGVLMSQLTDVFMPLPAKAVRTGDSWHNSITMDLPAAMLHLGTDRKYTLGDPQIRDGQKVAVVNWSSQVEYKPIAPDPTVSSMRIEKIVPNGESVNEGTILWDTDQNRPIRIDSVQRYDLTVTMHIEGDDVEAVSKGTDTFVIEYSDRNPDDEKTK